jgi:hypothetical protein
MHYFGGLTPPAVDAMTLTDFYRLCKWAENRETLLHG